MPFFEGKTIGQVKAMLRTKLTKIPENRVEKAPPGVFIPNSFDSRTAWPGCVHPILNQGQCGSCWAFGATESLSDRFCIASKGKVNVVLSPQSLVSCDVEGNMGCNGGIPHLAWDYMEWAGVVPLACFPYVSGSGNVPSCSSACSNATTYYAQKFSTHGYHDVKAIQNAIMTNGPVEGTFTVYQDFMAYSSGVYVHTTGQELGGHAIKMIGWGVDSQSGQDYWIISNSWGTDWGMNGFFWMIRGTDNCGIDSGADAGLPAL